MLDLEGDLEFLRRQALLRRLREITARRGTEVEYSGKALVDFSSNDYLGLAEAPFLREAAKAAIDEWGVGAGASRLVSGTRSPHLRLEERLAAFKGTEAALCFSSGYASAVGTISALMGKGDVLILDKLVHASMVDGARLSGAIIRVFPHNNLNKLEGHLQWARREHPKGRVMILTESVFSMDGDRAPLAEIVEIKDQYGAILMVDEAHAVGVIGREGRGLADRLGVANRIEIQMGTLSKALGGTGGYICGSRCLIDYLINRARSFVYSTAPAPATAATALAALDFLQSPEGEARRKQLWDNLKLLAEGLPVGRVPERLQSAIVPIVIGDEAEALGASKLLYEKGFYVPAIRYPTVAKGAARLRVTVSAGHTPEQIRAFTAALQALEEDPASAQ